MSINLIPRKDAQRAALRRQAGLALLGVAILWLALAAASLARLDQVEARVDERDGIAERVALLQAQVDSLAAFQDLADDVSTQNALLEMAMAEEVSWGRLLLQLSRAVPTSASFTAVDGTLVDPTAEGSDVTDLETDTQVGRFLISGYTTATFTPGVRELLLRADEIDGFFQQYVTNAQATDIGGIPATAFDAELRLDEGARTGRYDDGLPGVGE